MVMRELGGGHCGVGRRRGFECSLPSLAWRSSPSLSPEEDY
jgi:hypothetical protein